MDPAHPTQSHLVLEDNQSFSVIDVLAVDCSSAFVVTLSACRSAVQGLGLPDEFSSIAVAFLAAGAYTSVWTLWNVSDSTASLFSRRFFYLLRCGKSPRICAQAAQLWLRDTTNSEKSLWLESLGSPGSSAEKKLRQRLRDNGDQRWFTDPKHWAAFVCFGP